MNFGPYTEWVSKYPKRALDDSKHLNSIPFAPNLSENKSTYNSNWVSGRDYLVNGQGIKYEVLGTKYKVDGLSKSSNFSGENWQWVIW